MEDPLRKRNNLRRRLESGLCELEGHIGEYRRQLQESTDSVLYSTTAANMLGTVGRLIALQAQIEWEDKDLLLAKDIKVMPERM